MTNLRIRSAFFVLSFCLASPAVAQNYPGPLQGPTVLIPLLVSGQPGANGSIWNTELTAFNAGPNSISLVYSCVLSGCALYSIGPGEHEVIPSFGPSAMPAEYLSSWAGLEDVRFSLRVFDETRTESNWGTWIPVVRWDTLCTTQIDFLNVPVDEHSRYTLRLYTGAGSSAVVVVRYFNMDDGMLLHEAQPTFVEDYQRGGYAQLSSASLQLLDDVDHLRIEARVDDEQAPLWGLVSVTNDQTQAVTIIPANEKHCPPCSDN